MLLVCLKEEQYKDLQQKYPENINIIDSEQHKYIDNVKNPNYPINYLEDIKQSMAIYDVTIVYYSSDTIACLDAINIKYNLVYNIITNKQFINKFSFINCTKIELVADELEYLLWIVFDWIKIDTPEVEQENEQEVETETNELEPRQEQTEISTIPQNKNKLTFEQLVQEDIEITEADVRDLKATQNKLKVGMLLQAKSMLNRVLKLSKILDKLYDTLLDRIDESLDTTDTASLMYTTEYINKALSDTNQFMMSLINNEKIQNFFIIDNSTVINTSSDDKVQIDQREKIRKAAEIVLNNVDYIASGEFNELKNPNIIEVQPGGEEGNNVSTET